MKKWPDAVPRRFSWTLGEGGQALEQDPQGRCVDTAIKDTGLWRDLVDQADGCTL